MEETTNTQPDLNQETPAQVKAKAATETKPKATAAKPKAKKEVKVKLNGDGLVPGARVTNEDMRKVLAKRKIKIVAEVQAKTV